MNLTNIFNFITEKTGYQAPFRYKLLNRLPLTKEEQYIDGRLDLDDFEGTELPNNLEVNGMLYMRNSSIVALPEDLKVAYTIMAEGSALEYIPDNFQINGSLDLERTPIKQLPNNLNVGRTLWLGGTKIKSIPFGLKVGGDLYLWHTPIGSLYNEEALREMIEEKGGEINGNIFLDKT